MKKNFIISVVCLILCFLLIVTAIIFNIKEMEEYCMYAGMASTVIAFISVLFGLNSWSEK
ncbi:MAG: hypothetical protein IIT42_04125 [Clostridia bacterium]|nr:hypothetical protein [Clostridia bacterium]